MCQLEAAGSAISGDDLDVIEADLQRAGRIELGVSDADAAAVSAALRRVLHAWCRTAPEVGYSQGMHFVAAALLVDSGLDVEAGFRRFARLLRRLPEDWYTNALARSPCRCCCLLLSLRPRLPY